MPLSVEIKLNGRQIQTLWIGRLDDFKGEDEQHEYMCGWGSAELEAWNLARPDLLPRFHHTYSDGAAVCVRKALQAMESA